MYKFVNLVFFFLQFFYSVDFEFFYCTLFNIVIVLVVFFFFFFFWVGRQMFCSIQDDTCIESMVNVLVWTFDNVEY